MTKTIYEYTPDVVSAPGETLQEILDERGMSVSDFAWQSCYKNEAIIEIINGNVPITEEIAVQFERVLGVPAGFWMKREFLYQQSINKRS